MSQSTQTGGDLSKRRALPGWICAACWGVAIGLGYVFLDGARFEGVNGAWRPLPFVLAAVAVALIVTVLWARGASAVRTGVAEEPSLRRRQVLGSALRTLGVGVGGVAGLAAAAAARNSGWMRVTSPHSPPPRRPRARSPIRPGRARASSAIAGSGAPARWSPTSRSAPR